jgi:cytochrome b
VQPSRGLVSAFKGASHLVAALILVQAIIAGLFISGEESGAKDIHEIVGNILFVVVVAQLILAYLVRSWGRFNQFPWVAVLAILTFVQLGLGMASEDESIAEAIHIPLGVMIFGLAVVVSVVSLMQDRTDASESR